MARTSAGSHPHPQSGGSGSDRPQTSNPGPSPAPGVTPAARWTLAAAVALLVFLTFLPTLRAGFVDWDDTDSFLRNPNYRGLGGPQIKWMFTTFHMGHYQPLAWLTLGFDYAWGKALLPPDPVLGPGMNGLSYHLSSNLIHALNATLVFFLALQILARSGVRTGRHRWGLPLAAVFAALAWGLHPLRAESVSWITQRRDLLSAFFYLLTVIVYLHAQGTGVSRRRTWLLVALGTSVLCNLSKVIGVTLPFVLLVLDVYPLRRLRGGMRTWLSANSRAVFLEKIPFLAIALVFAGVASRGQAGMGALVPLSMHPVTGRIAVAAYGFLFYLIKTLVPIHLVPMYELHLPVRLAEPRFLLSIVGTIAVVVAVVTVRKRTPGIVAAAVCYAILFSPTSGIIQNGRQLVHDRYGYLSCVAWGIVVAGGLLWLAERARADSSRGAILAGSAGVLIALGIAASAQSRIWTSTASLWTHAARYAPDSSFAQNGYGYVLLGQGRYAEAETRLRAALEIQRDNEKAWENLYELLRKQNRTSDAAEVCRQALQAGMNAGAWQGKLGILQAESGNSDAAIESYRRSVAARPNDAPPHYNLGLALAGKGDLSGAEEQYLAALKADPMFNMARLNLAIVYERQGRRADAIRILEEALRVDPGYAKARRSLEQLRSAR